MISVPLLPETVTLSLRQAWRVTPEAEFRPGTVRLGWTPGTLHIHAELNDDAIFTRAVGFNEPLWERGDAFEMFLRPLPQTMYLEFHVAPGNHVLQMRFPDETIIQSQRNGTSPEPAQFYLVAERLFVSETSERNGVWEVRAAVPHATVRAGEQWRFSFSRYDASPTGETPVLSSTSAHTVLDFHDQTAWETMVFEE